MSAHWTKVIDIKLVVC